MAHCLFRLRGTLRKWFLLTQESLSPIRLSRGSRGRCLGTASSRMPAAASERRSGVWGEKKQDFSGEAVAERPGSKARDEKEGASCRDSAQWEQEPSDLLGVAKRLSLGGAICVQRERQQGCVVFASHGHPRAERRLFVGGAGESRKCSRFRHTVFLTAQGRLVDLLHVSASEHADAWPAWPAQCRIEDESRSSSRSCPATFVA